MGDEGVEGGGTQSRSVVDVLLEQRSREAQSWVQRAVHIAPSGAESFYTLEQLFFFRSSWLLEKPLQPGCHGRQRQGCSYNLRTNKLGNPDVHGQVEDGDKDICLQ